MRFPRCRIGPSTSSMPILPGTTGRNRGIPVPGAAAEAVRHCAAVGPDDPRNPDVGSMAADVRPLFMWWSNPHRDRAIDPEQHGGFARATVAFVRDRQRVDPGFRTMSLRELCPVMKRGGIPFPRGSRSVRQLVGGKRTRRSGKPREAERRVDSMFPEQIRIGLFAGRREGDQWRPVRGDSTRSAFRPREWSVSIGSGSRGTRPSDGGARSVFR